MAALQRIALPAPRTFGRHLSRRVLVVLAVTVGVSIAAVQVNQLSRAASTGYAIDDLRDSGLWTRRRTTSWRRR